MVYDELFGPLGQILLIGIGSGALIIVFLLAVCFFTPGCLGYECTRRRTKTDVNTPQRQYSSQQNDNFKLGDVSYRSWRLGSLYENGSTCEVAETQRDSMNSNNVPFESMESASTINLIKAEKQQNENRFKEFPTELTMSLQYLPPVDDNITGKLVIGIEAVSSLPPKQYNCTLEPYVALNIVKQSWTKRNRQKLHSFRTRGIRHTASPIYRETFVVSDVKLHEAKVLVLHPEDQSWWRNSDYRFRLPIRNFCLIGASVDKLQALQLCTRQEWVLDIAVYDHDRYANHTELSNLRLPLKYVKKIFCSPEIHMLSYRMKPSDREFGSILLGISYLPTAQRLTINVMKLRELKFIPIVTSVELFNPYVRVLMLNGKTGRKIKKSKTKFLRASPQPEFNETLTFDLSCNQLDTVQFLVVLCSKTVIEDATNGEHPSDSEDSVHSYKKSKDVYIGKIAFGKGVRGPQERLHWFSVLQNPRKLVTVWHTLK